MSAPDPDGMSMLAKVIGAAAAVLGPAGGLWLWIDSRYAKKHSVNNQFTPIVNEVALHRAYFKDVFEKIDEHAKRDEDHFERIEKAAEERHRELMMHLLERKS